MSDDGVRNEVRLAIENLARKAGEPQPWTEVESRATLSASAAEAHPVRPAVRAGLVISMAVAAAVVGWAGFGSAPDDQTVAGPSPSSDTTRSEAQQGNPGTEIELNAGATQVLPDGVVWVRVGMECPNLDLLLEPATAAPFEVDQHAPDPLTADSAIVRGHWRLSDASSVTLTVPGPLPQGEPLRSEPIEDTGWAEVVVEGPDGAYIAGPRPPGGVLPTTAARCQSIYTGKGMELEAFLQFIDGLDVQTDG